MLPQLVIATLALPLAMAQSETFSDVGCYSLTSLKSYLSSQGTYTYQTNSYCQQLCSAAGYSVAGTLDGSTCYCGKDLPSNIDTASSDKCDTSCNGYGTEICGGDGYLSISTDGEEDTSPAEVSSSSSTTTSSSTSTSSTSSTQSSSAQTFSTTSKSASYSSSSSTQATSSSSSQSSSTTSASSSSTQASSTTTSSSTSSSQPVTSVITSIITASNSEQTTTEVMTASTSEASSTASASSTSSSSGSKSSSGLSKGAIAGIAVGAILGVLILFGLFIFFFIRSRRNNDADDEDQYSEKHTPPPVHNDMSPSREGNHGFYNYGAGFGSQDAFQTVPPVPFYGSENGRKRLSNGSLPDARHEKTLRVTNPDETMNDTTLHDADQSYSDDEDSFDKFKA